MRAFIDCPPHIVRPKLFLGLVRLGHSLAICLLLRFVDEYDGLSKNMWLLVISGNGLLELNQLSVRGLDGFEQEFNSLRVPSQIVCLILGQLVATPDARRVMNFS